MLATSTVLGDGDCVEPPYFSSQLLYPAAVTVEIAAAQYSVAEDDGSVIITIRKNGLVAVPISITLTTIDGSAVGKLYLLYVIQLLYVCWIIERVHMFIPTGLCC